MPLLIPFIGVSVLAAYLLHNTWLFAPAVLPSVDLWSASRGRSRLASRRCPKPWGKARAKIFPGSCSAAPIPVDFEPANPRYMLLHGTYVGRLSIIGMLWLVAGCAGLGEFASATSPIASSAVSELEGTWIGTSGWVGAHLYIGESILTVHIRQDGTFTASVAPNRGANNLAKPSRLSGTVVVHGNRITLQNSEGPWTWLTLVRSGNTLYGVAVDPAFEANVMLRLDRAGARG